MHTSVYFTHTKTQAPECHCKVPQGRAIHNHTTPNNLNSQLSTHQSYDAILHIPILIFLCSPQISEPSFLKLYLYYQHLTPPPTSQKLEDARQGLTHPSNSKYSSWPHPPSFLSLFSQHCSNLISLPSLFWSHPCPLPQGLNRITCFLLYVFNLFLPSLIFPPKALKHI